MSTVKENKEGSYVQLNDAKFIFDGIFTINWTLIVACINCNKILVEHLLQKCTDGLVRTLRDLANSPYSPEYDVAGITDPFLHIRLLKLLRVLGEGDADATDSMTDILAQVSYMYIVIIVFFMLQWLFIYNFWMALHRWFCMLQTIYAFRISFPLALGFCEGKSWY